MSFTDAVTRGRNHLSQITGGGWEASGFVVRTVRGGLIGNLSRSTDAAFIAEAPTIIAMLIKELEEVKAEAKRARYSVSSNKDELTTLKDRISVAETRNKELEIQLDAARAELEFRRGGRAR